jgi:hypothetical protein
MIELVGKDLDIPDWLEKRCPSQLPRNEREREQLVDWFDEVWRHLLTKAVKANEEAWLAHPNDFLDRDSSQYDLLCQALVSVRKINPDITLKELNRFIQPKRRRGAPKKEHIKRMKDVAYTADLFEWIRPLLKQYYGKSPRDLAIYIACRLWNFGKWEDVGDDQGREFFPDDLKLEQHLKRPTKRRPEKLL